MNFKFLCVFLFEFFYLSQIAFAHEAYVIPYDDFWHKLGSTFSLQAFTALKSVENIRITFIIVVSVLLVFGLNFLFRMSSMGQKVHQSFEKFAHLGPHFVRITIGLALFFSAISNSFLGPELHISLFPYPHIVQISLFAISIMIILGIFTELAAIGGLILFVMCFFVFGSYVFTYLNYFGELIVLLLFGMRVFSFDRYLFGPLRRFRSFEKYETLIIRVSYGLALVYAAVTVKLLHPELTISVVNDWHLTQFHWLFPSDPLLVTFGAGIAELAIGLFIIIGFEMRLVVLITLFYITLSLFYFRELVWPHLLLYGISFNLLVQPEMFTLDHLIFKKHRIKKAWWMRMIMPHNKVGKSGHA